MNVRSVKELSPFDRLLYWVRERESIRRERALGLPAPWTDDEILQRYRFCNVRRMDDRVSDWLLRNWYRPYKDHPNIVVAVVLARNFNLPSTLEQVGFPETWEPGRLKRRLRDLKAKGGPIFNAAYMVRGMSKREPYYTPCKSDQVVDRMCQPLVDEPPTLDDGSMERSVEALLPRWGFSTFMAGQVVADLRWALTGAWRDRNTWAPIGPGSARGLERLVRTKTDLLQTVKDMKAALPAGVTKRLEAIDYQNCLCEFDKYERALHGEGRPKQLYRGGTGAT